MPDSTLLPKTPTTIGSWALLIARTLENCQIDSQALFEEAGLDLALAKNPESRFPVRTMAKVWELAVKKTNKNTWKILKGNTKKVRIKYEVYAFELTVRTSFLDLTHGFVSGSGVFMYVDGHKSNKGVVAVYPYKDFKVITTAMKETPEGVRADGSKTFSFENYDQLVDCPIEIGNQEVFSFLSFCVSSL